MSKEAALRAMREAKFAQRSAGSGAKPARPAVRPAVRPADNASGSTRPTPSEPVTPAAASDAVCGHRSMNGRSCTREQGHAAKSHRYS